MKTTPAERELLIEAVTSAHRARDAEDFPLPHPAWMDLDADGRREAFDAATQARALEAALAPDGLSTTGRAILARIRRSR